MLFRSPSLPYLALLVALVFLSFAFFPAAAFAQIPTIVPCNGPDCTVCHIGQLAQNVLNAGIYIAVFLAAILFAWAGWKYITAGGGDVGEAKKIFWNVGIGLVIILAAWLIVDLIIKMLVSQSALMGPWNKVC